MAMGDPGSAVPNGGSSNGVITTMNENNNIVGQGSELPNWSNRFGAQFAGPFGTGGGGSGPTQGQLYPLGRQ